MTKFKINNQTYVWTIDVNLLNLQLNSYILSPFTRGIFQLKVQNKAMLVIEALSLIGQKIIWMGGQ